MSPRPHIVFAVAGYAAIGMGHFYRALMFAHEFAQCRVSFCCTHESDDYAVAMAGRHFACHVQRHKHLAQDILALEPSLVINDVLDTSADYIRALKDRHLPVVNFEDLGSGAALADLVINALYEGHTDDTRFLCGHEYFCLRDEFLQAQRNAFRPNAQRLLLTFGGTDPKDYTRLCLESLLADCEALNLTLHIVAGPGYAHKQALTRRIAGLDSSGARIAYTDVSNVMSREMQGADAAVCSAGRTVYELAHMRIPSLVLAQHEREERHGFAAPERGFLTLGVQEAADTQRIRAAFLQLMQPKTRHTLHKAMQHLDFTANKARVVRRILELLESSLHG